MAAAAKKTSTKSDNRNVVNIKNDDIPAQIEVLREDVRLLAETVKSQIADTAKEKSAKAKAVASEKAELVKNRYEDLTSQAETQIRENPLSSIAIAVGAGVLLGLVSRR